MSDEIITNLTIEGYKSIRSLEDFKLNRFNVLIGANGSGKSNFIDFFSMLQAMFRDTNGTLQLFVAQKGGSSSLMHYGTLGIHGIAGKINFISNERVFQYTFGLQSSVNEELIFDFEDVDFRTDNEDTQNPHTFIKVGAKESIFVRNDLAAGSYLTLLAEYVLSRFRTVNAYHFHDTSPTSQMRVTQDLTGDDYLLPNAGNIAVVLHNLKANRPAHYRKILATVQLIAPFIRDFSVNPNPLNPNKVLLRWTDRAGDTFGPHQLSDGTLRAIALITALLQPVEMMPSIMIFDEPELGLHPAAISLVASLLKAASLKRQVIVATQSPILIRDYDPEDVVVVDRVEAELGRGESTFNRLDRTALGSWLDDFDLGQLYEKNVTGGGPQ